jgi:hypothetical protein
MELAVAWRYAVHRYSLCRQSTAGSWILTTRGFSSSGSGVLMYLILLHADAERERERVVGTLMFAPGWRSPDAESIPDPGECLARLHRQSKMARARVCAASSGQRQLTLPYDSLSSSPCVQMAAYPFQDPVLCAKPFASLLYSAMNRAGKSQSESYFYSVHRWTLQYLAVVGNLSPVRHAALDVDQVASGDLLSIWAGPPCALHADTVWINILTRQDVQDVRRSCAQSACGCGFSENLNTRRGDSDLQTEVVIVNFCLREAATEGPCSKLAELEARAPLGPAA